MKFLITTLFIISFYSYAQDCGRNIKKNSLKHETKSVMFYKRKFSTGFSWGADGKACMYLKFVNSKEVFWGDNNWLTITTEEDDELVLDNLSVDEEISGTYHSYCVNYQIKKKDYESLISQKIKRLSFSYRNIETEIQKSKSKKLFEMFNCLMDSKESSVNFKVDELNAVDFNSVSLSNFKIEHDEFTNTDFYYHKKSGRGGFLNSMVYMYFGKSGNAVGNPRIKMKYRGDNWIFFNEFWVLHNGVSVSLKVETETDVLTAGIVEVGDEIASAELIDLLSNINPDKPVKIRFKGKYTKDFSLLRNQRIALLETALLWLKLSEE